MSRVAPDPAAVRSRSAHTLWEVLLVIALLGVIGTLAVPLVPARRAAQENHLTRASRELADAFAGARLMALQRGESVQLVLDPATARLWLFARDHEVERLVGERALDVPPDLGLVTDDARLSIRFAPDGSASGGSVLVRSDAGLRRVTVDPWTGAAGAQ